MGYIRSNEEYDAKVLADSKDLPMTKQEKKREQAIILKVVLNGQIVRNMERLLESGLWGASLADVAERLISESIRESQYYVRPL